MEEQRPLSGSEDSIKEKVNDTTEGEKSEAIQQNTQTLSFPSRVYLKAVPLRDFEDVETIKHEVKSGNILILKVSPLAQKSVDDVKRAVGELSEFVRLIGGDIARLGEERVVITPNFVQIWREKNVTVE